jgi:ACR3 family arsenite efflux pump ArsB
MTAQAQAEVGFQPENKANCEYHESSFKYSILYLLCSSALIKFWVIGIFIKQKQILIHRPFSLASVCLSLTVYIYIHFNAVYRLSLTHLIPYRKQ